MYYSIPAMLSFQIFGIPFVGADICGFNGETNEELCARWMALGAFYPFARNHNTLGATPQEPYLWESVAKVSRKYLQIRYDLLPYWYTLFYESSRSGKTVVRPLFYEFPNDETTYTIDTQFMIGNSLLISPVLEPGVSMVRGYLPEGKWYDYATRQAINTIKAHYEDMNAPLDVIPIYVRGGNIIPQQAGAMTVSESLRNSYHLIIALDDQGKSKGTLFLDDGESQEITSFNYVTIEAAFEKPFGNIHANGIFGYHGMQGKLDRIEVWGIDFEPKHLMVNGAVMSDKIVYMDNVLLLVGLNLSMDHPLTLALQ
jgi:alpha-glucosidase/lysosomal alpha-glucosidase